jgi:hypothetical protein
LIKVTQTGEFNKITRYLEKARERFNIGIFDKYGKMGVDALTMATPVDTGKTAASWRYEIQNDANGATLSFHNDNVNNGVNIAIILQYGHGTGTGGWVEGRDYINPALQPIFDELADKIWKEVTKV